MGVKLGKSNRFGNIAWVLCRKKLTEPLTLGRFANGSLMQQDVAHEADRA